MNEGAGVWLFASMAISRAAMRLSVVWENSMATCEMKACISERKRVFSVMLRRFGCVTADFACLVSLIGGSARLARLRFWHVCRRSLSFFEILFRIDRNLMRSDGAVGRR